ncbi:MAG: HTH-type transcriptional repressor KstR2 [Pelotomaculum sp. PtaU1.Bin035]|nr:MAG: HTH-type transcriptional repressor KstR2 [Pelotomaculum sp. PtaU1.Bin035]
MDYRQRIVAAFKELAATRGFSGVTMDELAAHAGVSKRTIYRYFNSKEEIIIIMLEELMNILKQRVQQVLDSSGSPIEKIMDIVKVIPQIIEMIPPFALHDLQKHYPHLWDRIEQFRAGKIQQVFDSFLSSNEKGYFKNIEPIIITTALLAGIEAVINPAFIMENNFSIEKTIRSLFTIYFYGILADK